MRLGIPLFGTTTLFTQAYCKDAYENGAARETASYRNIGMAARVLPFCSAESRKARLLSASANSAAGRRGPAGAGVPGEEVVLGSYSLKGPNHLV
jgi:hypothetical protein